MAENKTLFEKWLETVKTPETAVITAEQIHQFLRAKGFACKEEPAVAAPAWKRRAVKALGGEMPRPRPARVWWEGAEDGFCLGVHADDEDKDVPVRWEKRLTTEGMSVVIKPVVSQRWWAVDRGAPDRARAGRLWEEFLGTVVTVPAPVPTPERVVLVAIPTGLRPWGWPDNQEGGYENPLRFLSEAREVLAVAEAAIASQREEWSAPSSSPDEEEAEGHRTCPDCGGGGCMACDGHGYRNW
jgi:hypothetical protein